MLGAIVLALMTLPAIIITSRAAIKSVPFQSKSCAEVGVKFQQHYITCYHSLPGMLTGAIIGMARALGETLLC